MSTLEIVESPDVNQAHVPDYSIDESLDILRKALRKHVTPDMSVFETFKVTQNLDIRPSHKNFLMSNSWGLLFQPHRKDYDRQRKEAALVLLFIQMIQRDFYSKPEASDWFQSAHSSLTEKDFEYAWAKLSGAIEYNYLSDSKKSMGKWYRLRRKQSKR